MLASREARELLHLWEDDQAATPSQAWNMSGPILAEELLD